MSDGETDDAVELYYRCYCTILHEHHNFYWFGDDERKFHIITFCDAFLACTEDTIDSGSRKPRFVTELVPSEEPHAENSLK